jgi:hypothetical protein
MLKSIRKSLKIAKEPQTQLKAETIVFSERFSEYKGLRHISNTH